MKTRPASDYRMNWRTKYPNRLRHALYIILALATGIAGGYFIHASYVLITDADARIVRADIARDEVYAVLNGKLQMIEPLGRLARRSVCKWELLTEDK